MAVKGKDLHAGQSAPVQLWRPLPAMLVRTLKTFRPVRLSSAGLFIPAAVLLALLLSLVGGWVQTKIDDLRYGRPRMDELAAFVGHEQVEGVPTQFIALNLDRRIVVLELPGGDPGNVRTIVGPYLFGQGEDLTPVSLAVRDLNGDQRPELLVTVKNEILVYINEPDGFRTMTPEEHQQLASNLGES